MCRCRCRCRCSPGHGHGLSLLDVVEVVLQHDGVAVDCVEGVGDNVTAVAGSLAGVLAGRLLLLLLLLCLAPGRTTTSFACGPSYDTTTSGAPAGNRTLDVVNDEGGKGLSRAVRPVPIAGAGAPAGVTARAATAAVATVVAVVAAAAHLTITLVL